MNGTAVINRSTNVISVSLEPKLVGVLDSLRLQSKQTRSSLVAFLIKEYALRKQWGKLIDWGEETAKKFKIASEDDIDKIIHQQ